MSAGAGRPRAADGWIAGGLSAGALALYAATLLPGIGSGDTAEFQRVLPTLDVAHPTGYPLYTLLGWLWSQLPLGSVAWRVSLFSAAAAALAVGVLFLVARAIGQARGAAAAAALALGMSRTFWSQATVAEVYALALLLLALLLLALLRWRDGCWRLWPAGLLLGLGLAHHRTIILVIPGAMLFGLIALWTGQARDAAGQAAAAQSQRGMPTRRWPGGGRHAGTQPAPILSIGDAALALLGLLAGCLLYLYLPLRAPAWLDSWGTLARVIMGSDALSVWLNVAEPWRVAAEHLRELAGRYLWPQLLPAGALLALLGLARVWRRDLALAALLTSGYLLTLAFCVLFFVQDVEVFLISAHVLAALLLGEGAMALAESWPAGRAQASWPGLRSPRLALLALALPALLLWQNLPAIRAANTIAPELAARALIGQKLPHGALLIVDWDAVESLRYLQAIEGLRPDLEVRPLNESVARRDADAALAAGRAVYLLHALPSLGLAQRPEGRLWRVERQPLALAATTPAERAWRGGIALVGYTLPAGPYRPGDIVPVTLAWQARAGTLPAYTLFVHLAGPDGALWGQQDRPPAPLPTDQWRAGERLTDLYGPTLRLDAPPGRYRVLVGWYSYPALDRLPLEDGGDALELGQIEVVPLR
ncbi:protein O-mannosyl-transferase family [Kouleothrix sp.]|uniref:protein O-mannosyl-transferase family n=1 Tax=Kouleothrix sp. TaxID=2779161 RepID=UPI003919E4C8